MAWYRPYADNWYVPYFHVQTVFDLYNIGGLPYPSTDAICDIMGLYSPSQEWYEETKQYYKSLDPTTLSCLLRYTFQGDGVINTFLRQGEAAGIAAARALPSYPFWDVLMALLPKTSLPASAILKTPRSTKLESEDDFAQVLVAVSWLQAHPELNHVSDVALAENLQSVADIIQSAIVSAPALDRPCLVFRGIVDKRHEYYNNAVVVASGFLSVTNDPMTALSFADKGVSLATSGKVLRMFLDAGVHVLPLLNSHLSEAELLLAHDTQMHIMECGVHKTAWSGKQGRDVTICDVEVRQTG